MARQYNFIYNKLVKDETDIIGHIAYSLYKIDKINYIESFKQKNDGKELEEDDIVHFNTMSSMDSSVNRYRNTAVTVLQSFADSVISQEVSNVEREYKKHLTSIISPLKTKWWEAILQSIIGAFIFALLVAAFAFLSQFNSNIKIEIKPAPVEKVVSE